MSTCGGSINNGRRKQGGASLNSPITGTSPKILELDVVFFTFSLYHLREQLIKCMVFPNSHPPSLSLFPGHRQSGVRSPVKTPWQCPCHQLTTWSLFVAKSLLTYVSRINSLFVGRSRTKFVQTAARIPDTCTPAENTSSVRKIHLFYLKNVISPGIE